MKTINAFSSMEECRKQVGRCQKEGLPLMAQANSDAYQYFLEKLLVSVGLREEKHENRSRTQSNH